LIRNSLNLNHNPSNELDHEREREMKLLMHSNSINHNNLLRRSLNSRNSRERERGHSKSNSPSRFNSISPERTKDDRFQDLLKERDLEKEKETGTVSTMDNEKMKVIGINEDKRKIDDYYERRLKEIKED